VQTCIAHLIRNSLPSINAIYRAEMADRPDPATGVEQVIPSFAFEPAIRKMVYTTNAVEALHRSLRKIIKTRGSFAASPMTMLPSSCFISPSRMPAWAGEVEPNGRTPWQFCDQSLCLNSLLCSRSRVKA
jgi:hypothetical protein